MAIEAARTIVLIWSGLLVEASIVHALTHGSLTILLNESSARRDISICSILLRRVMHLKLCSLVRLLASIVLHLNLTINLLLLGRVVHENLLLAWLLSKLSILHKQKLLIGQILLLVWKNELALVLRDRVNLWWRIAWCLHRQIFWRS